MYVAIVAAGTSVILALVSCFLYQLGYLVRKPLGDLFASSPPLADRSLLCSCCLVRGPGLSTLLLLYQDKRHYHAKDRPTPI